MMTKHFNCHPLFFSAANETIRSLYQKNYQEIYEYCISEKKEFLHAYLYTNWYRWERYVMWGRRHPRKIAFSRTTMLVEAHWSTIKRHFLSHFNRPRIDFLLFIIGTRLLPKVRQDFSKLLIGTEKPFWWWEFSRAWRSASSRPINGIYTTNQSQWICSCPAFQSSKFLICKHLVQNLPCPAYRDLVRNRSPPFLEIKRTSERLVADLAGELRSAFVQHDSDDPMWEPSGELLLENEDEADEQQSDDRSRELLAWTASHLTELASNGAGFRQIDHIGKRVLGRAVIERLKTYRQAVQRNLGARSQPETWRNADTVFLP